MDFTRLCLLLLFVSTCTTDFFPQCDGRSVHRKSKKLQLAKYLDVIGQKVSHVDGATNTQPYVSSPFTLPPFDSLPDNAPPYCSYPPNTPQTPSSPFTYISSPPPPPFYYLPPVLPSQSPPPTPTYGFPPSPPNLTPPYYYEPSPPSNVPSPPSPMVFVPSPPVFQPPVIYPPPSVPPPPHSAPNIALWCVAKPSVPDPIIQEAMNYACGTVADCDSILPNGPCFLPNTLYAHASYAFNSYWQRTKVGGGTCEFGGIAMLVTVDPSYDGCHFIYT
ncbi:leucine-rich repeat extensin-like protein 3 [Benincasa hispida]|uniref:leucine-rich repeat extensin-like protein 3 n=1 Tax=Benincasa hispida TaxID=102211 RepID=UPI0019014BC7|nr:leucine-rich repeat extensin-like protein 3 [Benincasa hispida]